MKNLIAFFDICCTAISAQPTHFTTSNAHSHNDYEQQHPSGLRGNMALGQSKLIFFA